MNAIEVSKIIGMLETNYKNFKVSNDEDALELWLKALKDLTYEECDMAVQRIIMEDVFPPVIATVRKAVAVIKTQIPTASDAWGEVERALVKYEANQDKKAIDSLSPLAGRVIGNMNWWGLKNSTNPATDRAHFLKMYTEIAENEKREEIMSPKLKIEQIEANKPKKLTEGEE